MTEVRHVAMSLKPFTTPSVVYLGQAYGETDGGHTAAQSSTPVPAAAHN